MSAQDPNTLRINALRLIQEGSYADAEEILLQLIKNEPLVCDDFVHLGTIYGLKKDWGKLESYSRKAIAINSESEAAQNNLAISLKNQKKYQLAAQIYQRIISSNPDSLESYLNLASIYDQTGKLDDAINALDKSLKIEPNRAATYNEMALILGKQNRVDEAFNYFEKAFTVNPSWPDSLINHGNLLARIGRQDEALEKYLKALQIDESNGLCLQNIASTLQSIGALQEALTFYNHALQNNFFSSDLYFNLGILLQDLNQLAESTEAFAQAHQLDPKNNTIISQHIMSKKKIADWRQMPNEELFVNTQSFGEGKAFDPFFFIGHYDDPDLQRKNATIHARNYLPIAYHSKEFQKNRKEKSTGHKNGKLKVGYFSSNFYNHPVLHLIKGVFSQHDTSNFDIYLIDTASRQNVDDQYLKELQDLPHNYIYIGDRILERALLTVRGFGLDVAVDLMGYTDDHKIPLFASGVAPVQINYLGYPGTTGDSNLNNYIIADDIVIPKGHEKYYSEKVVRLPGCYQCNDNKKKIGKITKLSSKHPSLEKAGFVFCCFNNTWKITAREFDIWMKLLGKNTNSVLWLLAGDNISMENFRKEALARDISPDRLVFAERMNLESHLARHQWGDLFLDTFTYNAHTTASDALWAGLPVLTMQGNSFPSRVGASILNAAELPELITTSEHEYESKAQWLVDHPDELQQLKDRLIKNRLKCSLFNTEKTTRHLEQIYRECWQETTGIISK